MIADVDGRETSGLEARALCVSYGGNVAVSGASLTAPLGRITGLIGPNGAGKTTTFNACNGLVRPTSGSVLLGGRDVTRVGTASRARLGMGRTFQQVQVCTGMSVRANVALGAEIALIGRNPLRQFAGGRGQRQVVAERTDAALETCGIGRLADASVTVLSTGQRRLVELARVLASGYQMLLLDEPSSGLDETETAHFGEILTGVVAERGVGMLLVEHDMSLVMKVCTYIYVLDFGNMIFEGTPAEVRASSQVRAAYLGEEDGLAAVAGEATS
ncbi:MAG TPA: ABC transporter ATP-binding protein [Mycobacteriales bacterium]|jgi:ABC-type branched-subunit amino acid transport system ATPase component|nr:ABC transporter ATP-binding protein [Mycobacteriales bacterium]